MTTFNLSASRVVSTGSLSIVMVSVSAGNVVAPYPDAEMNDDHSFNLLTHLATFQEPRLDACTIHDP